MNAGRRERWQRVGKRRALLAALLAATIPAACGDASSAAGEGITTDSAGVTIVTHGATDMPAGLAFHEEFRLGGSDTRPEESFYRVNARSIGIDEAGRLHVLDRDAREVIVFDDEGRHLQTLGGAGGGPGELGLPAAVAALPGGGSGVVDMSRDAIVRFGPDGEVLPSSPIPSDFVSGPVHLTEDALVVPVRVREEDGAHFADELVRLVDDDTVRLARVRSAEARPFRLESCGVGFTGMQPLFWPTVRWAARDARLAVASSAAYDVTIFEEGLEVRRIRRDIEHRAASEELAVQEQGEGLRLTLPSGEVECEAADVAENRGFAPEVPAVDRLALAPDGTLWVERGGVRGEPRPTDLFGSEGEYLGTLPPEAPFPLAFFPDGRFAAAETDELDVTRLVVYRIEPA